MTPYMLSVHLMCFGCRTLQKILSYKLTSHWVTLILTAYYQWHPHISQSLSAGKDFQSTSVPYPWSITESFGFFVLYFQLPFAAHVCVNSDNFLSFRANSNISPYGSGVLFFFLGSGMTFLMAAPVFSPNSFHCHEEMTRWMLMINGQDIVPWNNMTHVT